MVFIRNEEAHQTALNRYRQIKKVAKGTVEHKEKLLLAHLISEYEKANSTLPEVDPIEFIKIRVKDFDYRPPDLAKEYGDKGTVNKVLGYKQTLSLTMTRKFSALLKIPIENLVKEYQLKINRRYFTSPMVYFKYNLITFRF